MVQAFSEGLLKGNLPAEPNIEFSDSNMFLSCGVTTPENVRSILNPPVSVDAIQGIDVIDTNMIAGVSSGKTDGFLDYVMIIYKKNIFISDPTFYYYRSDYPVFDLTLRESNYESSKTKRKR